MKSPLLTIIAAGVGAVIGYYAVQHFLNPRSEAAFDKALVQISSDMNKNLPMMVDSETRLDTTVAGPGNRITYIYTVVNHTKDELDPATLKQTMRPQIIAGYKSGPHMKAFRERGVEMHYQYKDKSGEFVYELFVSPKDF